MADEVGLPKATVQKMVKEAMPADMRVSSELVDLLITCCTEFIQLVSSQANEVAEKEKRTTIQPDHVVSALQELGFNDFLPEVQAALQQFREDAKSSSKASLKRSKAEQAGLTEEEQIALQEQMFAAARAQSLTTAEAAALYQKHLLVTHSQTVGQQAGVQQEAQEEEDNLEDVSMDED